MTRSKREIDALTELHADTGAADRVRELLREADALNEQARQNRIKAGKLLATMRAEQSSADWKRRCGISPELAERLIEMAGSA